jgi:molecular chaperone DnaJ
VRALRRLGREAGHQSDDLHHLPRRGPQRGDLVVELFVETPTELNARQKELLAELAASLGESQTPRNTSFAGKAKRFWADILGGDADNPKETA